MPDELDPDFDHQRQVFETFYENLPIPEHEFNELQHVLLREWEITCNPHPDAPTTLMSAADLLLPCARIVNSARNVTLMGRLPPFIRSDPFVMSQLAVAQAAVCSGPVHQRLEALLAHRRQLGGNVRTRVRCPQAVTADLPFATMNTLGKRKPHHDDPGRFSSHPGHTGLSRADSDLAVMRIFLPLPHDTPPKPDPIRNDSSVAQMAHVVYTPYTGTRGNGYLTMRPRAYGHELLLPARSPPSTVQISSACPLTYISAQLCSANGHYFPALQCPRMGQSVLLEDGREVPYNLYLPQIDLHFQESRAGSASRYILRLYNVPCLSLSADGPSTSTSK
jgi:hypothetical protein